MSSQASQAKLAMEVDATFDSSSEPYEFVSIEDTSEYAFVHSEGIRGTRSHAKERTRAGLITPALSITMNPSAAELDKLIPRFMGAAESADTFALAETLPDVWVKIDHVAKCHRYNQGKVSRATFRCSAGQLVSLTLDMVFMSITESASGDFPSITIDTDDPYVFHDSASGVTLEGTGSRKFEECVIVIDNLCVPRFMNSQTATDLSPTDRIITFSCSTPYTSSETDLFTNFQSSMAGAAGSVVFTNGNKGLTFTFANLKNTARPPSIPGRGEIKLPLNFQAFTSSTTKELVITHDSTA